jgi:hypothetical protein
MGAVGILAFGLWLPRAALDSERIEVAAAAVVAVPIILGAAIGKVLGSAITGAVNGMVAHVAWSTHLPRSPPSP